MIILLTIFHFLRIVIISDKGKDHGDLCLYCITVRQYLEFNLPFGTAVGDFILTGFIVVNDTYLRNDLNAFC